MLHTQAVMFLLDFGERQWYVKRIEWRQKMSPDGSCPLYIVFVTVEVRGVRISRGFCNEQWQVKV